MPPNPPDPNPPDDLSRAPPQPADRSPPSAGAAGWAARLARVRGALWRALSPARRPARHPDPADGRARLPAAHLWPLGRRSGRALGRESLLAILLRLRLPAARPADRPELAGALAPARRPGRHRAVAARDHRRGPAQRGGQTAKPGAGQRRHDGPTQSDRPSPGLAPLSPRPRDPGP